jgi:hypothetical protein
LGRCCIAQRALPGHFGCSQLGLVTESISFGRAKQRDQRSIGSRPPGLCEEARFTHDVKAHDINANFENAAKPDVTSCHLIDSLSSPVLCDTAPTGRHPLPSSFGGSDSESSSELVLRQASPRDRSRQTRRYRRPGGVCRDMIEQSERTKCRAEEDGGLEKRAFGCL